MTKIKKSIIAAIVFAILTFNVTSAWAEEEVLQEGMTIMVTDESGESEEEMIVLQINDDGSYITETKEQAQKIGLKASCRHLHYVKRGNPKTVYRFVSRLKHEKSQQQKIVCMQCGHISYLHSDFQYLSHVFSTKKQCFKCGYIKK